MGIDVKPYVNSDKNSFAHTSLLKRWPAIVDGVIADVEKTASSAGSEQQAESAKIVEQIKAVKSAMASNAELGKLPEQLSKADIYNKEVPAGMKWLDAPWLLSECLSYRRLQEVFDESQHWQKYDMFALQKNHTFERSADAVSTLAHRYQAIKTQLASAQEADKKVLEVLFHEIISSSLWGNATDSSSLVTVSLEELKKLQVAAENRDKETLLVNDFEKVWKKSSSQKGGRVDIVLDNSGFESYTDLVMTLFLLDTKLADQVVLHPKDQPWFVSDVVPHDFSSVSRLSSDSTKFPQHRESIDAIVQKLTEYMSEGELIIRTSPFWTTPLPFWEIKENGLGGGDRLWRDLKQSKLVIFKGDSNYRKLTGDLMWPRTTPFKTAVQSLATAQIPSVTLRTVKADVCVGLPEGKAEELAENWKKNHPQDNPEGWAWSGHYAVINYIYGI